MSAPEPPPIRIGNAEREQAVQALGDHFAQGRLEPHEFEERMTAAYAARTAADLEVLFDDLPRPDAPRHPSTAQYPNAQYPNARYPNARYPNAQYPNAQYPGVPRPTATFPGPAVQPDGATHPLRPAAGPYPVGYDPQAPYGREPVTGLPYSDRSKVVAGLLQVFLPFGIGRLYSGQIGIGIAQLMLSVFFIGVLWAFVDGIIILVGRPTDPYGRPLRP